MEYREHKQLGNYRVLYLLGRGGFADVYLGEHLVDKTQVAIKVLRMQMASTDVAAFYREAQTIAHLKHPHIIEVLDYGVDEQDNAPFFIMQYAPKGTLRERYPKGAVLTPGSILPSIKQAASALQYAHDQKLIHRDVKPENMLLTAHDELLISDFGLAIIMHGSSYQQSNQDVAGTIAYMAPEQFQGHPRAASDQYALGVVAYEWLSGSRPFLGTAAEIQAQHLQALPARLSGRGLDISPAVEQVVFTALAKNPHQRFASIQDFANAFEAACSDKPIPLIPTWSIPYRRNSYFTGREDTIEYIFDTLRKDTADTPTQILAITGLGGIGKTQTTIEYIYRYRHMYRTVLWVRADSHELLFSDFAALAELLNLPEKKDPDQNHSIIAVKHWLETNTSWLLVFDNVEDPKTIKSILPSTTKGHILLTTRSYIEENSVSSIELDTLKTDEGTLFLLRRARIISSDGLLSDANEAERVAASEIASELDGLPLALDQAGAYIEGTDCGLVRYLQLYHTCHNELLRERGQFSLQHNQNHPESIAATLTLSFKKVLQSHPAAADLLRFCAFLQPDAIPEEIITENTTELGRQLGPIARNQMKLDAAIGELRKFSLIRRNPDMHTLTIHRLVQLSLKERMNKRVQRQWAERVVRAINHSFPIAHFEAWQQCRRLLPQAQACFVLVEQWHIHTLEAARLFFQTGNYLQQHALYNQAEPFLKRALALREALRGPLHLEVAEVLDTLGELSYQRGQYNQAMVLYQQGWNIREALLGPDHPDVALSIVNVAHFSYFIDNTKYDEAEQLFKRALATLEQTRGADHLDVARCLEHLSYLYDYQGKYAQTQPLLERVRAIREQHLGPGDPQVADSIANLARVSTIQGQYAQAEPLFKQALGIWEALNPDHPAIAHLLNTFAYFYINQGYYTQAEQPLLRALRIFEKVKGPQHHDIAKILDSLAHLYNIQGRYAEAEPRCQQGLIIHELNVGAEHADVAIVLNTLAEAYLPQAKYAETRPILERCSRVLQQDQRPDHPLMAATMTNWGDLYLALGEYNKAEPSYQTALDIYRRIYDEKHTQVQKSIYKLGNLYLLQGQYHQTESYCRQALEVLENVLHTDHPQIAPYRNTLALALLHQPSHNYDEAETQAKQALAIYESTFRAYHPQIAQYLDTLATIYCAQKKYAKAKPLYERALGICEKIWPPNHPDLAQILSHLAIFYAAQQRYTRAEKECLKALTILQKIFSADHPRILEALAILQTIHQRQGKA